MLEPSHAGPPCTKTSAGNSSLGAHIRERSRDWGARMRSLDASEIKQASPFLVLFFSFCARDASPLKKTVESLWLYHEARRGACGMTVIDMDGICLWLRLGTLPWGTCDTRPPFLRPRPSLPCLRLPASPPAQPSPTFPVEKSPLLSQYSALLFSFFPACDFRSSLRRKASRSRFPPFIITLPPTSCRRDVSPSSLLPSRHSMSLALSSQLLIPPVSSSFEVPSPWTCQTSEPSYLGGSCRRAPNLLHRRVNPQNIPLHTMRPHATDHLTGPQIVDASCG